jgi:hypothetical protein
LNEFLEIEGLTRYKEIAYKADTCDKQDPCSYVRKTRFAADGGIWADGCVVSELPGDSSLKLGTVDDSWEKIESNRKKIIDLWKNQRTIPYPCQKCTMYRNDDISMKNDHAIPLWKHLYQ